MNRDDVKKLLHERVVPIQFLKADGSIRRMIATLRSDYIPVREVKEEKSPRKQNDDVQAVYDTDKEDWRAFRWENLILVDGKGYHDSNN